MEAQSRLAHTQAAEHAAALAPVPFEEVKFFVASTSARTLSRTKEICGDDKILSVPVAGEWITERGWNVRSDC